MKIPKPRVNDSVETIDLRKMFGRVIKIIDNNEVLVDWGNGKQIEQITNLALVERR